MHLTIAPSLDSFTQHYQQGKPALLWTVLVADMETPVSAARKLLGDHETGFMLESVVGGETRGRYSIIGLKPDLLWHYDGDQAFICRDAQAAEPVFTPQTAPVLEGLRQLLAESRLEMPPELPPMASGLVGFLGYETVCLMEKLPEPKADPLHLPDGMLMRPQKMVIFDAAAGSVYLCLTVRPQNGLSAADAYARAQHSLQELAAKLAAPLPSTSAQAKPEQAETLPFKANMTREAYHGMVHKAKEYITAGDIFQVVPSQRFSTPFALPAFALYRSLRYLNPSPFLFYLNFGAFQLVGSSPEILVRARHQEVTIRPIAGTRKRGATPAEDQALAEELLADPKEVAEHLMLLDLGRNDVGRVAETGTVKVTERMIIERYSHVMHIVSNVIGKLRKDKDALDALAAGFPAGTVSGAPKIRAMEIIHELEPMPRKFYAGCVGYFSADGQMDSCIALRTALVKDGQLHIQAGGGVVADSDPEGEYQESCNKAKAVMRAAELAHHFKA